MATKYQEYKASLKGMNSIEFYIIKLQRYLGSKIILEKDGDCIRFQSVDPIKQSPDLSEIESDIKKRERDLKWDAPDLVKKTAADIKLAFQAEQNVNEGVLSGLMCKCGENTTAEIALTIMLKKDSLFMEICDYYANVRISEIANALDMTFDGNIEKL